MDHVPTLCAIGTVGIAATGFALGHPGQDNQTTPKSKGMSSRHARASVGSLPLGMVSPTRSPCSVPSSPYYTEPARRNAPFNVAAFDSEKSTVDLDRHRSSNFSAAKELISGGARRRRRQTYTGPPVGGLQESSTDINNGRPSSSWIRRLSVMSTKTEDQILSSRPMSPLMNEPSTPTSPLSPTQRRESNKLVKRSTSQHVISGRPESSRSTFCGSALRRPATSYQRSAHLRQQSILGGESESTISYGRRHSEMRYDVINERTEVTWRPYFTSFPDKPFEKLTSKSSPRRRQDHTVRRVVADSDVPPTLLLGSSVTHPDHANGRCRSSSHPPQFINPFQSSEAHPEDAASPTVRQRRKSKQSFTFNGFAAGNSLASWATRKRSSLRRGRSGSLPQGEVRAYSTLLERQPEPVRPGTSALPHRRKDVMDPSLFRRPVTMSQADPPSFTMTGLARPPGTFSSNIPPDTLPESNMDAAREGTASPTDARPSPQFSKPTELSSPTIQQTRGKRHSSGVSEPPSTVLGSDDRIFTSGEEDETDFQSDTAFDSFRTHDTTSTTSCTRGPCIETLFDKADMAPCGPLSARLSNPFPRISESDAGSIHLSHAPPLDDKITSVPSVKEVPGHRSSSSTDSSQQSMNSSCQDESRYGSLSNGAKDAELDRSRESSGTYSTASIQDDFRKPVKKKSDLGTRVSLFDWSEQPWNDRDFQDVEFRPRTVHGKQGTDTRGSRTTGRRGPSALHLRSQSVPVSREPAFSTDSRQSSVKFGTWGLGSKGVTEDWDGDFEFDDSDGQSIDDDTKAVTVNRQRGMKVPKAIMDRQASVQGQFGQVQELTLLVEELKRLRLHANLLQITQGPSNELWKEAEGIINLATLDDDDTASFPDTPPTTSYGFDDFDVEAASGSPEMSLSRSLPTTSYLSSHSSKDPSNAKSILETIYQQRGTPELLGGDGQPRKLPFDTDSLRDLVARAGVVTRALKDAIREAEGVAATSGNGQPPDPAFSRIFDHPVPEISHLQLVERT
ncbi:hypothetical protein DTO021D3_5130 [Paecilomyces variotii]|nr:hypothetical protein DTO032I3_8582 [Paecilomyces variotii]KAJ9271024.1 hypothetical protein DTO212C5_2969 [Paecilomyces variotii]KAJ9277998.1 hypothetical protein DTO021D3_5130 [Paecilomyces variotii]KAJ9338596.1 hypothetical protein DTO027B6_8881 [Paecilomyces variotii]KAJ9354210.1 hypothetical protein DTO027B9_4836 [Paecilomyces variotii]